VLFLRNRDLTSSRMVDRQREELKILNARQRVEMEETSNLLRDLHRAQAQLLAAEKLASLGRLSATLAHEIRNPLGIIASSVGMVAEDIDPASSAGQAIALVRDEIHRLNAIITDLLNFARPARPICNTMTSMTSCAAGSLRWASSFRRITCNSSRISTPRCPRCSWTPINFTRWFSTCCSTPATRWSQTAAAILSSARFWKARTRRF
jgi:signal transduction histidine kinase